MTSTPKAPGKAISSVNSASSTGSDSSSTSEEERLRQRFNSCDRDRDGFLDGVDFITMCRELNMEDAAAEIMAQLGMESNSRISFDDFIRYRSQVMREAEQTKYIDDTGIDSDTSGLAKAQNNVASWPTMSSDSLGAISGKPDSVDYDSGARDLSPEPVNLQHLMESHDPSAIQQLNDKVLNGSDFLELANRVSNNIGIIRDHHGSKFYYVADDTHNTRHFNTRSYKIEPRRSQMEPWRYQTLLWRSAIVKVAMVIPELCSSEKTSVKEEEEYDDSDAGQSNRSVDGGSINENKSQSVSLDIGTDLNAELSRVVTELESAIDERKQIAGTVETDTSDVIGTHRVEDDGIEEKALQVCKTKEVFDLDSLPPPLPPRLRPATFHPPPPPPPNEFPDPAYLQEEINSLREENSMLHDRIARQETDLNKYRAAIGSTQEEHENLKKKMQDLQLKIQTFDGSSSPQHSRTSTPTKSHHIKAVGERSGLLSDQFPVAKVAELKKLKTCSSDRQVLGSEISSQGLPNTKVAEHLVQSLQECSNIQEVVQTLYKCGNDMTDGKVKEFEIEFERFQSKIDHAKSQNDLLMLTLEESKASADRLTVLIGKYESNNTALNLALNYSDQALEAFDVLVALMESELEVMLANCRAAGLGSIAGSFVECEDQGEITSLLQRAHHGRKRTEGVAKQLLHKLDRCNGIQPPPTSPRPWEDLSSTSRTASTSSTGSSSDADFTKLDEQRLKDYLQQLKNDRAGVKMTVMELESVHVDPFENKPCKNHDAQRLDLENAVLMQELMALKEEKAELKAANYLMEKEKRAAELQLSGKKSQEQGYLAHIDHLKCEVKEQQQILNKDEKLKKESAGGTTPSVTLAELRSQDGNELAQDLAESHKREKKLKGRVQELVSALEKLSRNSETRHQQSADFVNDLKRANSALIAAFDKAKKKYQSRVKKMESQVQNVTEKYETQLRHLQQRLSAIENKSSRPTNETSL
ncbi:hypothetical protein ScPMuIL_002763 [Solemya velum]